MASHVEQGDQAGVGAGDVRERLRLGPCTLVIDEAPGGVSFGVDLVSQVTTPERYRFGDGRLRVAAYDFGLKRSILEQLSLFAAISSVAIDFDLATRVAPARSITSTM